MNKKNKHKTNHDPNHILDKTSPDFKVPEAEMTPKNKLINKLVQIKELALASQKSRFLSFAVIFAIVGGIFFLWSSFADSQVTFSNQVACIDQYAGNHKLVHNGSCTAYEINPVGLSTQRFTWCALASNADAWQNDGPCPAAAPPPLPTGNATYANQAACIDPTESNIHRFIHSGGCTQNEHGVAGDVSQSFTWCAAAANKNTWVNDGPCASTPNGFDVSIRANPTSVTVGKKTTVTWKIAGKTDGCAEVMGSDGSPDPFWTGTLRSNGSLTFAPPATVGRYTYGLHCTLKDDKGEVKTVGDASVTVIAQPGNLTLKSYTDVACISPSNEDKLFIHKDSCTGNEINQKFISARPFTWCATSSDATKWQNDGLCPVDPPSQSAASDQSTDQPDDNTPGDDNPDQGPQFSAAGQPKYMIHALYVLPCDYNGLTSAQQLCPSHVKHAHDLSLNRNYNKNGRIATSLNAINASIKPQIGGKILRLDKKGGKVDVTTVIIPHTYTEVASNSNKTNGDLDIIIKDLQKAGFDQKHYPNKIFAIYYEGVSAPKSSDCGVTDSTPGYYSVNFLRSCDAGGFDKYNNKIILEIGRDPKIINDVDDTTRHELIHALGFMHSSWLADGPQYCRSSDPTVIKDESSGKLYYDGHVNDDTSDIMYNPDLRDPDNKVYKDKHDELVGAHANIPVTKFTIDKDHKDYFFPKGQKPSNINKDPACNLNESHYLASK
jgi:hypothetical protein